MNLRTNLGEGSLSPELASAIAAAVGAFLIQEPSRSAAPRAGIPAWRRAARPRFGSPPRGWRERD